jgi:ATP-binding cassette subfamily F protein 3
MSFNAPHIMLLDEPTNHLDMDSREALMQALNNYPGAVILVSHDPHLVECVADRLWLVADGNCQNYDGDIEDYRQLVIRQRRKERQEAKQAVKAKKNTEGESASKPSALEKEASKLEDKVAKLTQKRDQLENEIANALSAGGHAAGHQLVDMNRLLAATVKELAAAEEAWMEAQEKLEGAA